MVAYVAGVSIENDCELSLNIRSMRCWASFGVLAAAVFSCLIHLRTAQAQALTSISTIGGGGAGSGESSLAACARYVNKIAWNPSDGSLLFSADDQVRLVRVNGTVAVVAGSGLTGFGGDGGPATRALFNTADGVLWDTATSFLVADSLNARIRRVAGGIIATVAGGGTGSDGPALSVRLVRPTGLALRQSDGSVFIADTDAHKVWRLHGNLMSTVIGVGASGFTTDGITFASNAISSPEALAVDPKDGAVVFSERPEGSQHRVRRLQLSSRNLTTIAGGGSGSSATVALDADVSSAKDMVVANDGSIFLSDSSARVRRISPAGLISSVAGASQGFAGDGGLAISASLRIARGLDIRPSDGALTLADSLNGRIRIIVAGVISTFALGGSGDGRMATETCLLPEAIAIDQSDGSVLVVEEFRDRVRRIFPSGIIVTILGTGETGFSADGPAAGAALSYPRGITVNGSDIYISESNNAVVRLLRNGRLITVAGSARVGGYSGDGGPARQAKLANPAGLAVRGSNLYIADAGNHRVRVVDDRGVITTLAGKGYPGFAGDGGLASDAVLNSPIHVAFHGSLTLITDMFNYVIRSVDMDGIIRPFAGTQSSGAGTSSGEVNATRVGLALPRGTVSTADGSGVYIVERDGGCRIRLVRQGIITMFAGISSLCGYTGDGEPATAFRLSAPTGIAVDLLDGSVVESEWSSGRIRRVQLLGSRMMLHSAVAVLDDPSCRSNVSAAALGQCQSLQASLHLRGSGLAEACRDGAMVLSWTSAPFLALAACNASYIIATFNISSDPGPWLWHLTGSSNVTVAILRNSVPAVLSSSTAVFALVPSQPAISCSSALLAWNSSIQLSGRLLGGSLSSVGSAVLLSVTGTSIALPLLTAVAEPRAFSDSLDVRLKYGADEWFRGLCSTCDAIVKVSVRLRSPTLAIGIQNPPPSFLTVPLHPGSFSLRVPRLLPLRSAVPARIPRPGALLPPGFLVLPTSLWTAADVAADGLEALVKPECHVRIGPAAASGANGSVSTVALPGCPSGDASGFQMFVPAGRGRELPLVLVLGGGLLSVPLGSISYAPTGLAAVYPRGVFLSANANGSNGSLQLLFSLAAPADDADLYRQLRIGACNCAGLASAASPAGAASGITCTVQLACLASQLGAGEDWKPLPVSFEWTGAWLPAQGGESSVSESSVQLAVVARPTVKRVAPASAAPETELVIFGEGFCKGDPTGDCSPASALAIRVGSVACLRVGILADFAATCTAPPVDSRSESGYPLLPIIVSNAAGVQAAAIMQVLYPSSGSVVLSAEHSSSSSRPPPSMYLPSDATEPWLLRESLSVRVMDALGAPISGSVSCSLAPRTVGVLLLPANRSAVDLSAVVGSGTIAFGRFLVQAPFGTGNVTVAASCVSVADATLQFLPLLLQLAPHPLSVALCQPLPTSARSLGALPPVRLALLAVDRPPAIAPADACAAGSAWAGLQPLPRISCTVHAVPLRSEAAAPIIQDGSAAFNLTSGNVAFDNLRVGGEVNQAYALSIQCAIGSIVLPDPMVASSTLLITGCSAGSQPKGSLCEPCAGDSYSDGGREPCRKCPSAGVDRSAGILRSLPGFYRPPAHANLALQLTSELHECPTPSRCLVNDSAAGLVVEGTDAAAVAASARTWYCAEGTAGPLCAACDEAAGYALIGGQCLPCAPVGVNGFVVASLVLAVLAGVVAVTLLKRRAASRGDGGRSGDSIALRILLTHVQAASSIRAFRLSGGEFYRRATAWMDLLSPAVLAQGPTQCAVRPSFEAVFWATLSAPLLICILSLLVLSIVEAIDVLQRRRRAPAARVIESQLSLASAANANSLRVNARRRIRRSFTGTLASTKAGKAVGFMVAVWNTGAPASILLFVLSLAYMPMLGAALSVFQCTQPIDGVRYITADVRVRCEASREYTAMAVAAGATLLFVGAGFPAFIVWRLRRAKPVHLMSQRFKTVWSFLFEGYRSGTVDLPSRSERSKKAAAAAVLPRAGIAPVAQLEGSGTTALDATTAAPGRESESMPATRNPLLLAQRRRAPPSSSSPSAPLPADNGSQVKRESHLPALTGSTITSAAAQPSWLLGSGESLLHWEAVVLARKAAVVGLARLVRQRA